MQDRVLDAADVLVDRQPAIDGGAGGRRFRVRVGEAGEIPRRIDEGVHRVGLAQARLAAERAGDVLPRRVAVERVAGLVDGDVIGKADGQVAFRNRHDAMVRAMDDGDRAAPVALARNAPVAQAIVHLARRLRAAGEEDVLQPVGDGGLGRGHRHAVEEAGIDELAVLEIGLAAAAELARARRRGRRRYRSVSTGATTGMIGRSYFLAKSKSRWSCAGQPKIAPVPYSISTKLAM